MPLTLANGLALPFSNGMEGGEAVLPFRAVTNRTFIPNEFGGAGNVSVMVQTRHILGADVAGKIRFGFANWRADGATGEVIPTSTATGRASVLYRTADGVKHLVRATAVVDGSDTASALPGENLDFEADLSGAPAGSRIFIRHYGSYPDGMNYSHWQADYANGDVFQYGASVTDLTGTETDFTNTWAGANDLFAPVYIVYQGSHKALGINGDSRESGLGDRPDTIWGNIGQFARLAGERMPYINVSVPGSLASVFADPAKSARRRALLTAYSDFHALGLGVNDAVAQGTAAATVLNDMQAIAQDIGLPTIAKTLDPWTAGSGGGNTTGNLTANDPKRQAINTALRGGVPWATGLYDPASVLEAADHTWTSTDYYLAGDFVHESSAGNTFAAANAGFDFALIGSPSTIELAPFTMAMFGSALWDFWNIDSATASTWPSEGVRGNALSQPTPANQPVPVAGQGIAETNAQFYGSAMPSGAGVEHVYWLIAFEFPTNGNTRYLLDSTAATGLQIGINASGQVQVNNKNTSNLWNGTLAAAQPHLFAIKTAAIGTGFRGSIDGATEVAGFGTSGLTGAGTIKLGPVGLSGSPGKIMVVARLDPTLSAADLAVAIGTMAWATGSQGSLDDGFAYKNNAPIL